MIARIAAELGAWSWMVLGLVLLIAEIVIPGVFFLWVGIAAIVTGAAVIVLAMTGLPYPSWQVQVLAFLALSFVTVMIGRKVSTGKAGATDALPGRLAGMVGTVATLAEPIVDGKGRVKIGDTQWQAVAEEDLPSGTRVRVVSAESTSLRLARA